TRNNLASNALAYDKLNYFVSGTAKAVTYDDLVKLVYGYLKTEARAAGRFVMSKYWLQRVMQLKGLNDHPLWQPAVAAGQPSTLMGYEVHEFADMPETDTAEAGSPIIEPI